MNLNDPDYDVVIDVLQKHHDKLHLMTQQNLNLGMFNAMDQIRMEMMSELERAMKLWSNYKTNDNEIDTNA